MSAKHMELQGNKEIDASASPRSAGRRPPGRSEHAADRLLEAVDKLAAPVCVGIDPVVERLPDELRSTTGDSAIVRAESIGRFAGAVCHSVAGHVPCVKFQSACFERYGSAGVAAIERAIADAHDCGLEVILDGKRGDIGISAEHYACAAFEPVNHDARADWVTINSYLGVDGINPFIARGGAFALVRTSNPSGDQVQALSLNDSKRTVARAVAQMIATAGASCIGKSGYSALGAVIGATKPDDARSLRALMPHQVFLVPGFGAQGGGVDDVLPCFNESGRGAIVTASRSVIYAFDGDTQPWRQAIADSAERLADDIGRAVGLR